MCFNLLLFDSSKHILGRLIDYVSDLGIEMIERYFVDDSKAVDTCLPNFGVG